MGSKDKFLPYFRNNLLSIRTPLHQNISSLFFFIGCHLRRIMSCRLNAKFIRLHYIKSPDSSADIAPQQTIVPSFYCLRGYPTVKRFSGSSRCAFSKLFVFGRYGCRFLLALPSPLGLIKFRFCFLVEQFADFSVNFIRNSHNNQCLSLSVTVTEKEIRQW